MQSAGAFYRRWIVSGLAMLSVGATLASAGPAEAVGRSPHRPVELIGEPFLLRLVADFEKDRDATLFRARIQAWYPEGSLREQLHHSDPHVRQAAVIGMSVAGTMKSSAALAAAMRDPDPEVRMLAGQVCWSVWFRGGTEQQNQRLRNIVDDARSRNPMEVLTRLNELIDDAPDFAEAINQRAIIHFQLGRWRESIADCERTLSLNPYHFGAMEGMGLCYRALDRPTEAVRALKRAHYLRPDSQELRRVLREMRGRAHQDPP